MADLDRPDRITNITGLKAQSETPDASPALPDGRAVGWPRTACRLCARPVWVFAASCPCGMPAPGRDARVPYLVRLTAGALAFVALAWWAAGGRLPGS